MELEEYWESEESEVYKNHENIRTLPNNEITEFIIPKDENILDHYLISLFNNGIKRIIVKGDDYLLKANMLLVHLSSPTFNQYEITNSSKKSKKDCQNNIDLIILMK